MTATEYYFARPEEPAKRSKKARASNTPYAFGGRKDRVVGYGSELICAIKKLIIIIDFYLSQYDWCNNKQIIIKSSTTLILVIIQLLTTYE